VNPACPFLQLFGAADFTSFCSPFMLWQCREQICLRRCLPLPFPGTGFPGTVPVPKGRAQREAPVGRELINGVAPSPPTCTVPPLLTIDTPPRRGRCNQGEVAAYRDYPPQASKETALASDLILSCPKNSPVSRKFARGLGTV
jgi:hypothetical protein